MPVFAQVALTFVLLFWMQFSRMRAIRRGQVPAHSVALREPNWPPRVTQIGNAYHNQLETPLLFYVLILLAIVTRTADSVLFVLSWLFVASRFVHAYIHLTSNRIDRRAPVFLVGAIGLALIAGRVPLAVVRLLAADDETAGEQEDRRAHASRHCYSRAAWCCIDSAQLRGRPTQR